MNDLVEQLRDVAEEMEEESNNIWAKVCVSAASEIERLQSRCAALSLALERVNSRFLLAIAGKPIRDVAETLGEVEAAMKERP